MHHTIFEWALVVTPIRPIKSPLANHFILVPLSSVPGAISPKVDTSALFYSTIETAVVVAAIRPNLDTFRAARIGNWRLLIAENSQTWLFVSLPHSFEYLLVVWGFKDADRYWLSVEPETFEAWAIRPWKFAVATSYQLWLLAIIIVRFTLMRLLPPILRRLACVC